MLPILDKNQEPRPLNAGGTDKNKPRPLTQVVLTSTKPTR
jgi:hypothetical protein